MTPDDNVGSPAEQTMAPPLAETGDSPDSLPLNPYANLVRLGPRLVFLVFRGRQFRQDELLPYDIVEARHLRTANLATLTGAAFVRLCMEERFGPIERWPALARRYLRLGSPARWMEIIAAPPVAGPA